MKNGLIIGKGWLGERLEKRLSSKYNFTTTKRVSDESNCLTIDFDKDEIPNLNSAAFDFIVITIPFGKRASVEELNFRFLNLIRFIGDYNQQIILISSTGIYPDIPQNINEKTFEQNQLNQPYQIIESKIKDAFPQLIILRLGGIMGDDRYLSKYLTLDKEDLDFAVNHIHFEDICAIIEKLIESKISSEIFNLVAPNHPTKEEVLHYQINQSMVQSNKKRGKTISSEKIINELNYQFIFENPVFFKLDTK